MFSHYIFWFLKTKSPFNKGFRRKKGVEVSNSGHCCKDRMGDSTMMKHCCSKMEEGDSSMQGHKMECDEEVGYTHKCHSNEVDKKKNN